VYLLYLRITMMAPEKGAESSTLSPFDPHQAERSMYICVNKITEEMGAENAMSSVLHEFMGVPQARLKMSFETTTEGTRARFSVDDIPLVARGRAANVELASLEGMSADEALGPLAQALNTFFWKKEAVITGRTRAQESNAIWVDRAIWVKPQAEKKERKPVIRGRVSKNCVIRGKALPGCPSQRRDLQLSLVDKMYCHPGKHTRGNSSVCPCPQHMANPHAEDTGEGADGKRPKMTQPMPSASDFEHFTASLQLGGENAVRHYVEGLQLGTPPCDIVRYFCGVEKTLAECCWQGLRDIASRDIGSSRALQSTIRALSRHPGMPKEPTAFAMWFTLKCDQWQGCEPRHVN